MKASAVATTKRPALATVIVHPNEWATTWEERPDRDVAFGIRLPSDQDEANARQEASSDAAEKFKESRDIEAAEAEWNDSVMALLVGFCLCDPNDYRMDHEALHHPQDTIRSALRSSCIRRLYHEIERIKVECSPITPEADDEDVVALGNLLVELDGVPDYLDDAARSRVRRHLACALAELEGD